MPLRGRIGGPPSSRGNLVNTKLTLPPSERSGEGSVADPKGGCTFFWRGKAKDEDKIHGVGLAIKTLLCTQLPDLTTPVSEQLMKLRFPLNPSQHVTVIRAHDPTLTSSNEAKDAFYGELNDLVKDVLPSDKLIMLMQATSSSSSCSQATSSAMREWIPTATTGKGY